MRAAFVILALALAASCDQPQKQEYPPAVEARPPVNALAGRSVSSWTVFSGTSEGDSFVLEPNGTISIQTQRLPVSAGDVYSGELRIVTDAPGRARLRVAAGCGAERDQASTEASITAGENTLAARHRFARNADCVRFVFIADTALSFRLVGATLTVQ